MQPLWDVAIEPVIRALAPRRIVEIGALFGGNTRKVLEACGEGAVIHAIDPAPRFDPKTLQDEFGDALVFHQGASLDVLPALPTFEAALIDGDHNWHTVYNELQAIEQKHPSAQDFPVLFLHDVCWPYGRRDLYYDVSRIPEPARQPFKKAGIRLWRSELDEDGGLNSHFDNACAEGGEKNGVLTALEDYVAGSLLDLQVTRIPAYFGLAIVAATERLRAQPHVAKAIEDLMSAGSLYNILERIEAVRCSGMEREHDLALKLKNAEAKLAAYEKDR